MLERLLGSRLAHPREAIRRGSALRQNLRLLGLELGVGQHTAITEISKLAQLVGAMLTAVSNVDDRAFTRLPVMSERQDSVPQSWFTQLRFMFSPLSARFGVQPGPTGKV